MGHKCFSHVPGPFLHRKVVYLLHGLVYNNKVKRMNLVMMSFTDTDTVLVAKLVISTLETPISNRTRPMLEMFEPHALASLVMALNESSTTLGLGAFFNANIG
jgi:hypothetical protein